MKKNIAIIICALIWLSTLVVSGVFSSGQNNQLDAQAVEIGNLNNKIEMQKTYNKTDDAQAVLKASGLNVVRKAEDDRTAEDFLKFVFTWDSLSEYNQIRDTLEDDYGMSSDNQFIKSFMPSVAQFDSNGMRYGSGSDSGFNLEYEGMKSYVTNISNGKYSYFTIVTVSSTSKDGNEGVGSVAMLYTIDDGHNISDISGYVVS